MSVDVELLVHRHKDAVYRQMVRVCGNHSDADDALAEAISSAVESAETLNDPCSFRSWLTKVATRCCTRLQVKSRLANLPATKSLGSALTSGGLDAFGEVEVKQCVLAAVAKLKAPYRDVYMACEIEGLPAPLAAERLETTVQIVKIRLHRAREMVRQQLDQDLGTN